MPNSLAQHLHKLCVEIGTRPIGSAANQSAADYVRESFLSAGLNVEEQPYACTGWDCRGQSLSLDGEALPVQANAFSPGCEVSAPLVTATSIEELAAADLDGKIALLHGEIASSPLSPKSWFLKGERDDAIIHLLEAKRPAALLAPPPNTPQYEQFTCDWELDIPAATIPAEIVAHLLARPGALHLKLDCGNRPATARNIVAQTRRTHAKKMVLMAHFDTRIHTPGACDNAGGAATLLALAERLADETLPFELEFVAFNGEEYLPMGDDEYVRRAGEESFANIQMAINIDGAGLAKGQNTIAAFNVPAELLGQIEATIHHYPGIAWTEPWPQSNHSTFAFRGVPALAFSSNGAWDIAHYPGDSIDKVSVEKLAEIVAAVSQLINR